jgi:1,2-diacylglycerol 3-beta-galactosyltransferase
LVVVDQKRILVLTADAGFGHRSAANAVAAALERRHGDVCEVQIANPLDDKRVPGFLRESQADYDKLVRNAPKLYSLGYDLSDAPAPAAVIDSGLTLMLFEALRHLAKVTRPDAIVTTYPLYQAPLRAVFQFQRRQVPLLTVVTDLATVHTIWFHDAADLCLVPTAKVRDLALRNGLEPGRVRITGIPIQPRPIGGDAGLAERRAQLGWQRDPVAVLVVGSRRTGGLVEVVRLLNHAALPLQLAIVAGGDETLHHQIADMDWHVPAKVYGYVEDLPEMMRAADCIVCKAGGLIVSEALAAGLPMVLVDVLPGQEVGNAEHVVEHGAGVRADGPIEVLEGLHHWLDDGGAELGARAAAARRLGRPDAAYAVAELVYAAAQSGPKAGRIHQRPGDRSRLIAWLKRNNLVLTDED